jgi:hypothetical protein
MKKINLLFIGCFLLIISLPLLFMDRKSTVSEKENRVLAVFPNLVESALKNDGKIDAENTKNIPQLLDNYINDRFGFRHSIVSLANTLNWISKTINGYVIRGKDGWFFYTKPDDGNNIGDFLKKNLLTDVEIGQFIENIEKRLAWCNSNDIEFIFLIAPNKHNVYPEYYPFVRPEGITRTGQIMAALPDKLKNIVIYPLDHIIQNKTNGLPLYFETDTHWNMAGAYCAFNILFKRIKQIFPNTTFQDIQFITDIRYDFSGDLLLMSGLTNYRRTIPDMRPLAGWESYYQYTEKKDWNGGGFSTVIIKNDNRLLPRAIIFRDSFCKFLEPFVSTQFSSAEYYWRSFAESDKNYILENKPDIIIWEVIERSILSRVLDSEWN